MTHCPKDKSLLSLDAGYLVCAGGHAFRVEADARTALISPHLPVAAPEEANRLRSKGSKKPAAANVAQELLAAKLESAVEAECMQWLTLRGVWFHQTKADCAFDRDGNQVRRIVPGWSDLTAIAPHWSEFTYRFWAIECKRPVGGRLSYDQAVFLMGVYAASGVVTIARSVDDLEAALLDRGASHLDEINRAFLKGK